MQKREIIKNKPVIKKIALKKRAILWRKIKKGWTAENNLLKSFPAAHH